MTLAVGGRTCTQCDVFQAKVYFYIDFWWANLLFQHLPYTKYQTLFNHGSTIASVIAPSKPAPVKCITHAASITKWPMVQNHSSHCGPTHTAGHQGVFRKHFVYFAYLFLETLINAPLDFRI